MDPNLLVPPLSLSLQKMVHKGSSILFFSLLLSSFLAPTHGKKQTEALGLLYKAKLTKNSAVDMSGFEGIRHDRVEVLPQDGLKERDRIEKLPGQPNVEFSQYGGYVTVDESTGKAFYYYFVEAQKSHQSLPLLLWLNGGNHFHFMFCFLVFLFFVFCFCG